MRWRRLHHAMFCADFLAVLRRRHMHRLCVSRVPGLARRRIPCSALPWCLARVGGVADGDRHDRPVRYMKLIDDLGAIGAPWLLGDVALLLMLALIALTGLVLLSVRTTGADGAGAVGAPRLHPGVLRGAAASKMVHGPSLSRAAAPGGRAEHETLGWGVTRRDRSAAPGGDEVGRLRSRNRRRPACARADIKEADDLVLGVQPQPGFHEGIVGRGAGLPHRTITQSGRSEDDGLRGSSRRSDLLHVRDFRIPLQLRCNGDDGRRAERLLALTCQFARPRGRPRRRIDSAIRSPKAPR